MTLLCLFHLPISIKYGRHSVADAALVSKGAHEFEALTEYIHKNLDKDLSLAALSKQACLSAGYLARRFKTVMGVSPLKYVLMVRMERAREMLAVEKRASVRS